ncbi:GNAT family N-acetyltransferase [Gordonia jacobaea]|uniref:GNAT family N-acetyltransferase n=1 Tax=Gordonia jacobaea TaxID=122202 RepID=UPI003D703BC6
MRAIYPDARDTDRVLDDVVNQSLAHDHRHFVVRSGRIVRYHPLVAGFIGHPPDITTEDWHDLTLLVPAGVQFTLRDLTRPPEAGFSVVARHVAVQMTGEHVNPPPRSTTGSPRIEKLTPDDVPEMLALVELTRLGPFLRRTIELGGYVGIRHEGALVAMAGERLRPPGWSEISAVCVHPDHRNRGYASALVTAVAAGVREAGRIPFLHANGLNENAIRLYEALRFRHHRTVTLTALLAP